MTEDAYLKLREFLDQMPGGFPLSESGTELKVLEILYSPEEAEMTVHLRQFPEPPSIIAARLGMSEAAAADQLASMARKGLIMSISSGDKTFYQPSQFVLGIYEYQVDSMDREFAEMMEEFMEGCVEPNAGFQRSILRQFRIVPVDTAVDATTSVASYEQIRQLVRRQKLAAVMPCICCKEQALLDNRCEKTPERCLTFGLGAQYIIHNGKGRQITIEKALENIDRAEEEALILLPSNSKDILHICLCCGSCCGVLRVLKMQERPADHIHSAFQARLDPESCAACGTCLERCQMGAIIETEEAMRIDTARCIGCGLCVATCGQGAITLAPRHGVTSVPVNYLDMLSGMSKDRGLGFGKLNQVMKRTKVPLFVKMLPLMYRSGLAKPMVNLMAKWGWV